MGCNDGCIDRCLKVSQHLSLEIEIDLVVAKNLGLALIGV